MELSSALDQSGDAIMGFIDEEQVDESIILDAYAFKYLLSTCYNEKTGEYYLKIK